MKEVIRGDEPIERYQLDLQFCGFTEIYSFSLLFICPDPNFTVLVHSHGSHRLHSHLKPQRSIRIYRPDLIVHIIFLNVTNIKFQCELVTVPN